MKNLSIDIETFSYIDIKKTGAFKYAESEDFEILLFAYKEDNLPTKVIDLASGEKIPNHIISALKDRTIIKHAYNAVFEWFCLNRAGYKTDINQWQCTMIHGLYCGYPAGLEAIGKAMGLPEDKQKLSTGKALINYFCKPCKKTKTNGGRTRNLPKHDIEKWNLFKEYNAQDVETEYAILQLLRPYPVPEREWNLYRHDVLMNARGIKVDDDLLMGALLINERSTNALMARAQELTGLINPNSNVQLLEWIRSRGIKMENIQKGTVEDTLSKNIPSDVREVLEIRQKLGKTSVRKYTAMEDAKCSDNRVKGLLQFYGANRSGRWAGRLVQVQNLPRNYLSTLDIARELVKSKNFTALNLLYGNIPDTLSQLIRTAFVPEDGKKFIVCDFSAIEARVIAWLAGEDWVLDVFRQGGDIYCATASQMFSVPVEKGGANGYLRQKGKIATLALGYQGGPKALVAMGALDMGIDENELQDIVDRWRIANQRIVNLWYEIERAVRKCIQSGNTTYLKCLTFRLEGSVENNQIFLTIELPSKRKLFYCNPAIETNNYGRPSITYEGLNQTNKKWCQQETYGGKLVENTVQAIARDCLDITLERCIKSGYMPVMHIHDEIVIEAEKEQKLEDIKDIFAMPIDWAPGLPLSGAGFESKYYKKD